MFISFPGEFMESFKQFLPGIIILILFALLCTQIESKNEQISHVTKFDNLYEASNTPYPLQNFIYLDTFMEISNQAGEEAGQTVNAASGIAVKNKDDKVYAFTAGHWCSVDNTDIEATSAIINLMYPEITIKFHKRVAFYGKFYSIEEMFIDEKNDLCVITFTSPYANRIRNIKPARKDPEIGEKLYTISSPLGIFNHEIKLIFDGYFSGCRPQNNQCFYTIPGVQGSSGSGVLNRRGDLVSVLGVSVIDFYEVTGGSNLESVREMYDTHIR